MAYYRYAYACVEDTECGVANNNVTPTCLADGDTADQAPNTGVPCGTDADCTGGTKCGYRDFSGAAPPTSDSDPHYQWYVDIGLVDYAATVNLTPTTMTQCAMDQWVY